MASRVVLQSNPHTPQTAPGIGARKRTALFPLVTQTAPIL